MCDSELCISLNQSLVQHLLFLIGHIRNQQGEERHQLLNLTSQHGIHFAVVNLVNQLHLRRDGMPDLHDVDAVRGTGSNLDELAADLLAGSAELVSLDGSQDKTLDPSHSHAQRQKLHGKGLACTAGA